MSFRRLPLAVLLLLLPAVARADQPVPPPLDPAAIDAYAQKLLDDWKAPGLALAVVRDDRVVLAKGYGVRTAGKSEPVDEHTLFSIASCSKAFTAAALAILVDEGKLRWEDKVTQHLPGFQLYDPYVTRELTVRDLLCHRSGLPTFGGDLVWYHTTYGRADVLRRLRHLRPTTSFRSAYGYQNILFLAAGEVVPAATGTAWDDFVRERVFRPLGMTGATTSIADLRGRGATPHMVRAGAAVLVPPCPSDNMAPAASVNAGARDLAQWLRLQLGLGQYEGTRVYSEAQARAMWSPQTITAGLRGDPRQPAASHLRAYALGWFVSDYHGRLRVEHDGSLDGMFSKVILIPEAKLGVMALTNSDTPAATVLAGHVVDTALGLPPRDRHAEELAAAKAADLAKAAAWAKAVAARARDTKPSLPPAQYTGRYVSDLYGDVRVAEEAGKLVVRFVPTPVFVADLEHWHHDTFQLKWRTVNPYIPDGWATFVLDRHGRVDELKVDCPNPDFDFTELELKRKE
jgi:CubicO group peptidase (beta-lactamase class C family)